MSQRVNNNIKHCFTYAAAAIAVCLIVSCNGVRLTGNGLNLCNYDLSQLQSCSTCLATCADTDDRKRAHRIASKNEFKEQQSEASHTLYAVVMTVIILGLLMLCYMTHTRKRAMQAHLQLTRMKLLSTRNRISPHFIFNVLNHHISTTDKKDAGELMALAKLIRANLNMSGKFYVSMKEELEFVNYYISVVRPSLGDDFVFSIDAPEDEVLEGISCPSMFVQILVENAIKHGLKIKSGEKKLHISVERGDRCCTVSVADNGPGFDIRRINPNSTGTGLNVMRTSISIINSLNKRKITLAINNTKAADGTITGCTTSLVLPDGLKQHYDNQL